MEEKNSPIVISVERIPLAFDIGGQEVELSIRASAPQLMALSRACQKASAEMEPVEGMRDAAVEAGDLEAVEKLDRQLAGSMASVLKACFRDSGYKQLAMAIGGGEEPDMADCAGPFLQIMTAALQAMQEHFNVSAAHPTAGAVDALQTADPGII